MLIGDWPAATGVKLPVIESDETNVPVNSIVSVLPTRLIEILDDGSCPGIGGKLMTGGMGVVGSIVGPVLKKVG